MEKFHLKLTESEIGLLSRIDLRDNLPVGVDAHEVYKSNRAPILALLKSLTSRHAIPEHRRRFFNDPAYNFGRVKGSRQEIFERNGNEGAEVFEHPHFKKHLRYFLFGPDLPDGAIADFESKVLDPKWVSGSDYIELGKAAIAIARLYGVPKRSAAEEFFKLALDMGISFYSAVGLQSIIRKSGLKP